MRQEQHALKEEASHYRSKCIAAAAEKSAILESYHRDVLLLLNVVDGLLTRVEGPSFHGHTRCTDIQAGVSAQVNNTNPPLATSGGRRTENNASSRMSLLSQVIGEISERGVASPVSNGMAKQKKTGKDKNLRSGETPQVVSLNESLQEISMALSLQLLDGCIGMTLLHGPTETNAAGRLLTDQSQGEEAPSTEPYLFLEHDLRDIAATAHNNVETYLHSLNYGFPSVVGPHVPLAVQMQIPLEHASFGGNGS